MKVIKNYLYNLSYQILTIILPIITVPYVTRIFTSEDLGNYGFYNSIVSYFSLFAMLGIGIYGTKQIAAARNVSSTFWNIYAIQLTASILALFVYVITLVSIPKMSGMVPIILGIVLLTKMIDISWLFTGKEDFKKITLRNTMVKVAGVISIFTFIKSSEDLYLYIFLIVIFDFLGQFVMWIPAKKFIKRPSFDTKIIKKNLHPIVLLFLPQVAISLYVVLDRTLLGLLGSYSDVGIYEQGQKLTSILLTVVSSLGAVMLPRVANLLSERKEKEAQNMVRFSFILYNLIIFPMIFGLIAINEIFVKLFLGQNFQDVKYVLYIIVFNIMFIGWTNILGYQVLVVRNKNKEFMLSTTIPAIVSVAVNIAVIPFFGYIGASITSVVVEFLVFAIQWYYSRNIINKNLLFNKDLAKIICSSLVMFGVVMLCKIMLGFDGIVGLVIYLVVGGISYLAMIFLLKTVNIKEMKGMLK
jgi:flippase wzx